MSDFDKTEKQDQAIELLASKAKHVMLYGGSRSGKSFIAIYAIIIRACKTKSRHVCLRLKFNHAKTSLWHETIPKVLSLCFPNLKVIFNKSDFYILFPNGSEIWVGGLDDSERVEKILGKEYSTIFFNECSQIPYRSIQIAITRLAEKNILSKKCYYDENPPHKRHWSYWLFIKKQNPDTGEKIKDNNYESILMNPVDNLVNIDEEYLDILNELPEKQRQRFLSGEFGTEGEGLSYYSFNYEKNVLECNKQAGTIYIGVDFNVQPMTAVIGQFLGGVFYIFDEQFLENSNTPQLMFELKKKYSGARIIPDSTGRNRKTSGLSDFQIIQENGFVIESTYNPIVFDRVNNINRLLEKGLLVISPRCKKLINDLEKVSWKGVDLDKKSDPMLTHISDALGYLCWKLNPMSPELKVKKIGTTQR